MQVDDDDADDPVTETENGAAPEVKDDAVILLEDHADTRSRSTAPEGTPNDTPEGAVKDKGQDGDQGQRSASREGAGQQEAMAPGDL